VTSPPTAARTEAARAARVAPQPATAGGRRALASARSCACDAATRGLSAVSHLLSVSTGVVDSHPY
jgi:hypothetical protein